MIFDLLRDGFSFELVLNIGVRLFFIIFLLPVHEFAHAYVATKLGDPTAKNMGRLTLNPLAHIDPIGSFLMLFAGFGYAKAVPVNIRNFRFEKRKRNMALIAFAGPFSNVIMAFVFAFFYFLLIKTGYGSNAFAGNLASICMIATQCNVTLAVFNLLPIPPLDGSRILSLIIPDKYYYKMMQYERYILIGVLVLAATGALEVPLSFISNLILRVIFVLYGTIFGLTIG